MEFEVVEWIYVAQNGGLLVNTLMKLNLHKR
jgi:hypothetical protein